MKKLLRIGFALLLFTCSIFTACKKDNDSNSPASGSNNNASDTVPPVITITGSNPMTVTLNSAFVDPGATATDNSNFTITVTNNSSVTNPNVNLAGTYIITYSATDHAGSMAVATRTVVVENSAMSLSGN